MNEQSRSEERSRSADFQSAVSPACSRLTDGLQSDVRRLKTCDTAECNSALPHSELLILPDGRILVHNLTPTFADLLCELNPDEEQIASRGSQVKDNASRIKSHELPD